MNAMLLMGNSANVSQALPSGKTKYSFIRDQNALTVPFNYDFSGWLDNSEDSSADGVANDASSNDAKSSAYADGEGSICRSIASGEQQFGDALSAAKGLLPDEANRLRASRAQITHYCATNRLNADWTAPSGITSPIGKQFVRYLSGTAAFYAEQFIPATIAFAGVSHSSDPWLRETALYMTGRAQLNAAQDAVFNSDYALRRDKVLNIAADAAQKVFIAYLRVYPRGLYAQSAAGLMRRLAWLEGDSNRQSALYDKAFAEWSPTASPIKLSELANEFASKFLETPNLDPSSLQSMSALAIWDLMRMRSYGPFYSTDVKPITFEALQAQKPRFAKNPALFDYLTAVYRVYLDHQPDQALSLLPELSPSATSLDYMAFSQQTLRGFALEDLGQSDKARALWLQLFPIAKLHLQRPTLELALAINYERAGQVANVFAEHSLIHDAAIRSILLERDADAVLLRAQAQNRGNGATMRDLAVYTLLYKELTRGLYGDFLSDMSLVSSKPSDLLKPFTQAAIPTESPYRCPAVATLAATLIVNAHDSMGLNCLAEFVRSTMPTNSSIDDSSNDLSQATDGSAIALSPAQVASLKWPPLGNAPSQFAGKPYRRMQSYQAVIADPQAPANDRAYALYRAINCFAPGGYSECGGNDLPKSVRKQWFTDLKTQYSQTPWARALRYYW